MTLPPLYDESDYEALREEKDKRIAELEAENESLYETACREAGTVTAFMTHQDTYNKVLRENVRRAKDAEAELAALRGRLQMACVDLAQFSKEWHEQRDPYDTGYDADWFASELESRWAAREEEK